MSLPGGTANARAPSDEEVELLVALRPDVEARLGKAAAAFEVVQVATQVVAGTNYFAKVHIGDGAHVHIRVYKPLPHTSQPAELAGLLTDKAADDELGYFESN